MVCYLRVAKEARLPYVGTCWVVRSICPGWSIWMHRRLSAFFITRMSASAHPAEVRSFHLMLTSSLSALCYICYVDTQELNTDSPKALLTKACFWCIDYRLMLKCGTVFRESVLHFKQRRSDRKSIYVGFPDALCSTRKNRNWCKRNGSYRRIHAKLWTEAVWLKSHIYLQPGRALFNQEKSKLMQTKGQLSESAMLLFRLHHLRFFP